MTHTCKLYFNIVAVETVTTPWDEILCPLSTQVTVTFFETKLHCCFHIVISFKPTGLSEVASELKTDEATCARQKPCTEMVYRSNCGVLSINRPTGVRRYVAQLLAYSNK